MPEDRLPPFRILSREESLAEERVALDLSEDAQPTSLCLSGGGIRSAGLLPRCRAWHSAGYWDSSIISQPYRAVVTSAPG